MSRLLVIGCGGVAQVAISKICQDSEPFNEIMIASRTDVYKRQEESIFTRLYHSDREIPC